MKKRTTLAAVFLTLAIILSMARVSRVAAQEWYDWDYYVELEVRNNATVPLPSGYTVSLVLDTASLISQGQMQSDCADLCISYDDGATEVELDRLVEGCNSSSTTVTFRTQAEIGVGRDAFLGDGAYVLGYGDVEIRGADVPGEVGQGAGHAPGGLGVAEDGGRLVVADVGVGAQAAGAEVEQAHGRLAAGGHAGGSVLVDRGHVYECQLAVDGLALVVVYLEKAVFQVYQQAALR